MNRNSDELYPSQEFDENEMAAEDYELNFEEDEQNPQNRAGDKLTSKAAKRRVQRNNDDMAEVGEDTALINEDGSRSPDEPDGMSPPDKTVNIKNRNEAGLGDGLDEQELANVDPLDQSK